MRQHVSVLGVLYIAFGALGVLTALGFLVLFGGLAGLVGTVGVAEDPDAALAVPILGGIGLFMAVFVGVLSIPGLVVGYGLVKFRPWGRIGGIVLSVLNLLNVPIGTVLGIYGLWVLLSQETEAVFAAA
jgi:hypothetical protein